MSVVVVVVFVVVAVAVLVAVVLAAAAAEGAGLPLKRCGTVGSLGMCRGRWATLTASVESSGTKFENAILYRTMPNLGEWQNEQGTHCWGMAGE